MKRVLTAIASGLIVLVGFSAAASAQTEPEVELEPEVTVDNPEPAPGDEITVDINNLEPDTAVNVTLGDNVADGIADPEGLASIGIVVPDEPGELDGIVLVNGVEVPFSVLVQSLGEDGTVQPEGVNTGDELSSSGNATALFAAAAGLLLVSGAAFVMRRRFVES